MAPPTASARGQAKYTSRREPEKADGVVGLPTEPRADLHFCGSRGKFDPQEQLISGPSTENIPRRLAMLLRA